MEEWQELAPERRRAREEARKKRAIARAEQAEYEASQRLRDALVEFYETSFGDSSWENVEGWEDMTEELRNWYGLTLDRDGNLVRMKVCVRTQVVVL